MPRFNPARGQNAPLEGGGGFNPNAAGKKSYGMGRPFPNYGKTTDKAGYGQRDALNEQKARAEAIRQRMKGM